MTRVTAELDALYADGREVTYQALREIPQLENCFKETLRLHPPLILLMRKVAQPFYVQGLDGAGREERRRVDRGLEPRPERASAIPTASTRRATSPGAQRISTSSRGSRSARAGIAASARRSR